MTTEELLKAIRVKIERRINEIAEMGEAGVVRHQELETLVALETYIDSLQEPIADASKTIEDAAVQAHIRLEESEDLSFFNIFKVGAEWQKEQMLEDAISCNVSWCDGPYLDYTQKQQDLILRKIGADVDDKVKVIIVKED